MTRERTARAAISASCRGPGSIGRCWRRARLAGPGPPGLACSPRARRGPAAPSHSGSRQSWTASESAPPGAWECQARRASQAALFAGASDVRFSVLVGDRDLDQVALERNEIPPSGCQRWRRVCIAMRAREPALRRAWARLLMRDVDRDVTMGVRASQRAKPRVIAPSAPSTDISARFQLVRRARVFARQRCVPCALGARASLRNDAGGSASTRRRTTMSAKRGCPCQNRWCAARTPGASTACRSSCRVSARPGSRRRSTSPGSRPRQYIGVAGGEGGQRRIKLLAAVTRIVAATRPTASKELDTLVTG